MDNACKEDKVSNIELSEKTENNTDETLNVQIHCDDSNVATESEASSVEPNEIDIDAELNDALAEG